MTRDRTERAEGLEAGAVMLVGTEQDRVYAATRTILDDDGVHAAMSLAGHGLYGDGRAAERIAERLADDLTEG